MEMKYWMNYSSFDSREEALACFDSLSGMVKVGIIVDALNIQGIEENQAAIENLAGIIMLADGTAGHDVVEWAMTTMEYIVEEDAHGCPSDDWMQGYDGLGVEYKGSEEESE